MELTMLYRPIGQEELELIEANGFRSFPPRLPEQPFFYPVLNEGYAIQIARDWNTRDAASGFRGYVVSFGVSKAFLNRYEPKVVGSSVHREYWIPAEDLAEFNRHIEGTIKVVAHFENQKEGS